MFFLDFLMDTLWYLSQGQCFLLAFDPKQQITENIERNFHSECRSEYWLYLEEIKQLNTIYFQCLKLKSKPSIKE